MAGSNQAVNLGGMLSQMNSDLSKKPDVSGLMRNIENMSRPDAQGGDLESQQKLFDWQQKMGREDAARTTMTGMRDLREEQRRAAEEKRKADLTAGGRAEAQIQQAMTAAIMDPSIDPVEQSKRIAALQDQLINVSEKYGTDATRTAGMAQKLFQQRDQQKLQGLQTAAAEGAALEKKEQESLMTQIQQAKIEPGTAQWEAFMKTPVAAKNTTFLQQYAARDVQLKEANQRNEERIKNLSTKPDYSFINSRLSDDALPPERKTYYSEQLETIQATADAKMTDNGGKWANPAEKDLFTQRVNNLQQSIEREVFMLASAQIAENKSVETFNRGVDKQIAGMKIAKAEADPISKAIRQAAGEGVVNTTQGADAPLASTAFTNIPSVVATANSILTDAGLEGTLTEKDVVGLSPDQLGRSLLRKIKTQQLTSAKMEPGPSAFGGKPEVINLDEQG